MSSNMHHLNDHLPYTPNPPEDSNVTNSTPRHMESHSSNGMILHCMAFLIARKYLLNYYVRFRCPKTLLEFADGRKQCKGLQGSNDFSKIDCKKWYWRLNKFALTNIWLPRKCCHGPRLLAECDDQWPPHHQKGPAPQHRWFNLNSLPAFCVS